MMRTLYFKSFFFFMLPFFILSCGGGATESEIAKKITFTITQGAIVLPNDLDSTRTCVDSGVTGPRVRLRSTIKWEGQGNLLPLVVQIQLSDIRLKNEFTGTISPNTDDAESLASFYDGIATDFIPSGTTTYETANCYFDFGGFPEPVNELTGENQLTVTGDVRLFGIVRDSEGNDTPFTKEIRADFRYVGGSIPVD